MTREEQINIASEIFSSNDILSFGGACEELSYGFQEGAKWADKNPINVWHDASEDPKEDMDILLISKNGKVNKVSKIDQTLYDWLKDNDGIDKWAYIDDLLPKGGGK